MSYGAMKLKDAVKAVKLSVAIVVLVGLTHPQQRVKNVGFGQMPVDFTRLNRRLYTDSIEIVDWAFSILSLRRCGILNAISNIIPLPNILWHIRYLYIIALSEDGIFNNGSRLILLT